MVWSLSSKKYINAIENNQRRFTKMVTGLKDVPCNDRLRTLGLPSLFYRRKGADMMQLFKIMQQYDPFALKNINCLTTCLVDINTN